MARPRRPTVFTDTHREHLLRAFDRPGVDVTAAIVLYADHNPVLLRFNPLGYQDTNFARLGSWMRDSASVTQSGFALPGASCLRRLTAQNYQLAVMCPPEDRVVPVSYLLGACWDPFVEARKGTGNPLTYVRVHVPPTMWTLQMRWSSNGDAVYDPNGTLIHAIGRTRFRHFGLGNVSRSDGSVCWGSRLSTVQGVTSIKQVQDLFYQSPFNTDLQEARFLWNALHLPTMVQTALTRHPAITSIPARCLAGRGLRRMGTPQTYLQRHIDGSV